MILGINIQVSDALVSIQELDPAFEISDAYLASLLKFDAGSLINADCVAAHV